MMALAITSAALLCASVLLSVFAPRWRVWPPPKRSSWQFWLTWLLNGTGSGAVVVLAVSQWKNACWWGLLPIGFGLFINFYSVSRLGVNGSAGVAATLRTTGPYRYCRNPQYLGNVIYLIGVCCFAPQTAPAACAMALYFLLLPFSEEPWLLGIYGQSYAHYKARTPRFIPRFVDSEGRSERRRVDSVALDPRDEP